MILAAGMFEISVRALRLDRVLDLRLQYHPDFGWTQRPLASYRFTAQGRDIDVAFNSMGFHDREHAFKKPHSVRRIVVIGDSFCESVQVNLNETFYRVLEDRLNQGHQIPRWEVINLGVGDYGT